MSAGGKSMASYVTTLTENAQRKTTGGKTLFAGDFPM
jgi:hypothetical protein